MLFPSPSLVICNTACLSRSRSRCRSYMFVCYFVKCLSLSLLPPSPIFASIHRLPPSPCVHVTLQPCWSRYLDDEFCVFHHVCMCLTKAERRAQITYIDDWQKPIKCVDCVLVFIHHRQSRSGCNFHNIVGARNLPVLPLKTREKNSHAR